MTLGVLLRLKFLLNGYLPRIGLLKEFLALIFANNVLFAHFLAILTFDYSEVVGVLGVANDTFDFTNGSLLHALLVSKFRALLLW